MNQILLIEDDKLIAKGLIFSLKQNNYLVDNASNYQDTLAYLKQKHYDLIIIDITLPDGNGFDLGKIISSMNIPFIFLTAKDEEEDILKGLDIAEDYITKPFHMQELLKRINKILLRYPKKNIIIYDNITIDLDKCIVLVNNKEISLTSLEYRILIYLLTNRNKVIPREILLEKIWDVEGNYVNDNTLSVYIKRIREKLHNNDLIKTIKGIGYRIDDK